MNYIQPFIKTKFKNRFHTGLLWKWFLKHRRQIAHKRGQLPMIQRIYNQGLLRNSSSNVSGESLDQNNSKHDPRAANPLSI